MWGNIWYGSIQIFNRTGRNLFRLEKGTMSKSTSPLYCNTSGKRIGILTGGHSLVPISSFMLPKLSVFRVVDGILSYIKGLPLLSWDIKYKSDFENRFSSSSSLSYTFLIYSFAVILALKKHIKPYCTKDIYWKSIIFAVQIMSIKNC